MAWLFSQSETDKLVSEIKEKLNKQDMVVTLINSDILTKEQKVTFDASINKAIESYLYYEPQLKQIKAKTDQHLQVVAKKEESKKLAERGKDIVCQIHGAKELDFIQLMLNPGILEEKQQNDFTTFITKQIVNFMANLKEEDLRQILANLGNYKQVTETNRKKAEDITLLRHKGTVKANIVSLENLVKNPPKRRTQIITTRCVAIPEAFTKKMQDIHNRKLDDIKVPKDERIHIRETYAGGRVRMIGFKLKKEKVGTWRWWNTEGELIAEYNFTNQTWFYKTANKKIIRNNTHPETETDQSFLEWLTEEVRH